MATVYNKIKDGIFEDRKRYNFSDRQIHRKQGGTLIQQLGISPKNVPVYLTQFMKKDVVIGWYLYCGDNGKKEIWLNMITNNIFFRRKK